MRCVSVFFHSLVPVSDTSDPLKRLPGRQHPRSRSRPIQPCKERTMLHAARPRGHMPGRGQPSRPVRKRERFETETRRRPRPASSRRLCAGRRSPYNRLTVGARLDWMHASALALFRGSPPPDRNPPHRVVTLAVASHARCSTAPTATTAPRDAWRHAWGSCCAARRCGSFSGARRRPARASRKHASIRTRNTVRAHCLASKDPPCP